MQIYRNTYKEYTVGDIYNDFRDMYHAYPKVFTDIYDVEDPYIKQISLAFMPIELVSPPVVKVYPNRTDYQNHINDVTLIEGTDYHIDYDMGLIYLTGTVPLSVGNVLIFTGQYNIINIRQFVQHLNKALRVTSKYFPIRTFYEYKQTNTGETTVTKIDTTELPFSDVNDVWQNIEDKYPIKFIRRGQYLVINEPKGSLLYNVNDTMTYPVYTGNGDSNEITLPVYIEGNEKPQKIEWTNHRSSVKQSIFKFAEDGYDALLCFIGIEMYRTRLRYSAEVNLYTLRLNEKGIQSLLMDLSREYSFLVRDTAISKGLYAASSITKEATLNNNT